MDYEQQDFDNAQDHVRNRQRFKRRPKRSADVLTQLLARQGYGQTKSIGDLSEAWDQAVGSQWIDKTKPGNISRGVLEVFVSNSGVHQQLNFQKKKILNALHEKLPQNKIKDIRFRTGNVAR
jgi:predicted nucleic acid-binding Zn ribbon protein